MAVDTLRTFGARMERVAAATAGAPPNLVLAAAKSYQKAVLASTARVVPSFKLRNVGKTGSRIGARVVPLSSGSALVQATGPYQLIELDTAKHQIPRATRAKRARTAAGRLSHKRVDTGRATRNQHPILVINGNVITGPVNHPGTKGKHPFETGFLAGQSIATLEAFTRFNTALAAIFA